MRVKLTVHLEDYPGGGRDAAVEGAIIEFHVRAPSMIPRAAAAEFREWARAFQNKLQTPATPTPPLSHVSV